MTGFRLFEGGGAGGEGGPLHAQGLAFFKTGGGGPGPGVFRRALTDYYFWRVPCAGPWQPVAALLQTTTFGARKRLETPGPGPTPKKSFWYEMDMNDTKCTSNDVRFWSHFLLKPLIKHAPNYIFGARDGSPFMIRNLNFEGILDSKKALGVGPGPGGFTVSYRLLLWRLSPVRCSEVRTAPERRSYRLLL